MIEIELKARVKNREEITQKLNEIGKFDKNLQKIDFYYELNGVRFRFRREEKTDLDGKKITNFFTYKRKEIKDGIEVNDEKECIVDDFSPLETMLIDAGAKIVLKKEKKVQVWKIQKINAELCNVPPLGDFLELEILTSDDSKENVENQKIKLLKVLEKCGISKNEIEPRYYSDLLRNSTSE